MLLGLAFGGLAVMATEAITRDFAVVDVDSRPTALHMAVRANVRRFGMLVRLALGHVTVVTAEASGWHTFEDGARMAGFTSYLEMSAFKLKCSEVVLEVQVNLDCIRRSLS